MKKPSDQSNGDGDANNRGKAPAPRLIYITIEGSQGEGKSSIARSVVSMLCADAWHVILHDEDERPRDFGSGPDVIHVFCIQKDVA